MAADDTLILLGVIGAAHGIKGEVRIKAFTGDPLAIADYGPLTDDKGRRFEIAEVRPAKEVVVARIKGITSREAAESLNGVNLFVARDQIPAPEDEDEFLQADLIGCAVVGPDGVVLGTVTTVAGIHLRLPRYDRRQVDGLWMHERDICSVIDELVAMDYAQRQANACIGRERADLVLAGCAIFEAIRRAFPSPKVRIADRGLREGILLRMMHEDRAWWRRR